MDKPGAAEDQAYFDFRRSITGRPLGIEDLDHFPLYVGAHNMARKYFILTEFMKTLDITGDIFEFGLWRGATLVMLAKFLRLCCPYQEKKVVGFDNFSGLPEATQEDGPAKDSNKGMYKGDYRELMDIIEASDLSSRSRIIDGDANGTISAYFSEYSHRPVSFALLDFDLFSPTKVAVEHIVPRLSLGGKILFDQASGESFPGEGKCLPVLLRLGKENHMSLEVKENILTRQPSTVVTRVG